MEHHDVIQMSGKIAASFHAFFNQLDGNTELRKLFSQIKSGLSAADNHNLLQIGVFAFLVYSFVQLDNLIFFPDDVKVIFFSDFIVTVRNDDLAVSGNGSNEHIWHDFSHLWNGKTDKFAEFSGGKLDKGDFAAGKNTVAQSVFLSKIFIDFQCNGKVRVDDGIDSHGLLDEPELIHVFRISDPCDNTSAAQLLCKGGDYHVGLVVIGGSQKILKVFDIQILQHADIPCVSVNGHDIQLLGKLLQNIVVFIYNCNGIISAEQCFRNTET